jgi:type IV pilus assembly protein PilE
MPLPVAAPLPIVSGPKGEPIVKRTRGFTLIEIMLVVLVIAILVAIAFPSYQQHLRKGRRANAEAFLSDLAAREQQYLLDARGYAIGGTALTDLSIGVPTDVSNYYTVNVTPATATIPPSFTATATPIVGGVQQSPVDDGVIVIDNLGTKQRLVGGVDKGW